MLKTLHENICDSYNRLLTLLRINTLAKCIGKKPIYINSRLHGYDMGLTSMHYEFKESDLNMLRESMTDLYDDLNDLRRHTPKDIGDNEEIVCQDMRRITSMLNMPAFCEATGISHRDWNSRVNPNEKRYHLRQDHLEKMKAHLGTVLNLLLSEIENLNKISAH